MKREGDNRPRSSAVGEGDERSRRGRAGGWMALAAWVAGIWLFVFVLAPWLQAHVSPVGRLAESIEASGIDAGALYYTEVEEAGEADLAVRDTFRYFLGRRPLMQESPRGEDKEPSI